MKLLKYFVGLLIVVVALPILAYLSGTVYFVPEYMNAVVTRFGEIQYSVLTGVRADDEEELRPDLKRGKVEPVIEFTFSEIRERYSEGMVKRGAGIYFKIPFVDQVHFFDSRVMIWEGEEHEVSTKDLRSLITRANARWRIVDPIEFYKSLGDERQALTRLASEINSSVEDLISETLLIETVRNQNLALDERVEERLKTTDEGVEGDTEIESTQIRYGRGDMLGKIEQDIAQKLLDNYGIQLVDVLLTRLNYPTSVRKSVYERMKAERNRIAERYESEGEKLKRTILGEVRRRENELISGADRQVEEILGRAEERAISIWADAYQRAPDFFKFRRSLKAYEEGLQKNGVFILSDGNRLLEYTTAPSPGE